jgi:hypothetical protein
VVVVVVVPAVTFFESNESGLAGTGGSLPSDSLPDDDEPEPLVAVDADEEAVNPLSTEEEEEEGVLGVEEEVVEEGGGVSAPMLAEVGEVLLLPDPVEDVEEVEEVGGFGRFFCELEPDPELEEDEEEPELDEVPEEIKEPDDELLDEDLLELGDDDVADVDFDELLEPLLELEDEPPPLLLLPLPLLVSLLLLLLLLLLEEVTAVGNGEPLCDFVEDEDAVLLDVAVDDDAAVDTEEPWPETDTVVLPAPDATVDVTVDATVDPMADAAEDVEDTAEAAEAVAEAAATVEPWLWEKRNEANEANE